jgi:hypothetical protein
MERRPAVFLISSLVFVLLIPSPVQGLCINAEACDILGGIFLSMLTVPICLVLFAFAIWPKTRPWLEVLAVLPGFMAILTGYLMVFQTARFDLILVPLIHAGLMIAMIGVGRWKRKT